MINWNADHIDFVIVAYVIVFIVLAAIVIATLMRASTLKKTLGDMKIPDTGQKD